ncbi:hypothetical protein KY346_06430 [Candidatus Woesearchaeota archaeon]|nr:hypothetical protein [Candidatus Woesearchaeota archaeon]
MTDKEFEAALGEPGGDYEIGDVRKVGKTTMKVYGIKEEGAVAGRIDASFRPTQTSVVITGSQAEDIANKLIEETDFDWEPQ